MRFLYLIVFSALSIAPAGAWKAPAGREQSGDAKQERGILLDTEKTESLKDFLKRLKGKRLFLRESFNSSPKVYCEPAGPDNFFIFQDDRLMPFDEELEVVIESVKLFSLKKRVKVAFRHFQLGAGSVMFYWPRDKKPSAAGLKEMMRYAFSETGRGEGEGEDGFKPYVGNSRSRRVHYAGCNHLPQDSLRENFLTLEAALEKGYKECSLCFRDYPALPDYRLERYLGRKAAAELRAMYPSSRSYSLRERVRKAGARVLDHWPTALRGYYYSFEVLNSGALNAFACPAGRVFITSGLLRALESESELDGILAHEITHVERRHGLSEFKQELSVSLGATLGAVAADALLWTRVKDWRLGLWLSDIVNMAAVLVPRWVAAGYSRVHEREADFSAIAYLEQAGRDKSSYVSVLRKMQYAANLYGRVEDRPQGFDTHPQIEYRVECAENAIVKTFGPDAVFTGYDRNGEPVAVLRLVSQCLSKGMVLGKPSTTSLSDYYNAGRDLPRLVRRLYLYATVSANTGLGKVSRIDGIKVKTSRGATVKLDNREDTALLPAGETGCIFERDTDKLLTFEIEGIELDLNNVKEWRPGKEGDL
ncbi:MAG: M48 family metallopeptidase [Gemmatimonadota bacterium]|nr:M48 family metallopeptidase [Gemmatimonadota bacterium]